MPTKAEEQGLKEIAHLLYKDPEELTEEDIQTVVKYLRDQRVKWAEAEEKKKTRAAVAREKAKAEKKGKPSKAVADFLASSTKEASSG